MAWLLTVAASAACGVEPGSNGSGQTAIHIQRAYALIGQQGGTLEHSVDGRSARVVVPPGSVEYETTFTIEYLGRVSAATPCGVWSLGPSGQTFALAVEVILSCRDDDLTWAVAPSFAIATFTSGAWERLTQVPGDWTFAAGQTSHFSEFAVVVDAGYLFDARGTTFAVGSTALESTSTVHLVAMRVWPQEVSATLEADASATTQLAVRGLRPNALLHVFDGSLQNETTVITDQDGRAEFTQDLSGGRHTVFIRTAGGTAVIRAPGGGHCTSFGDWNAATNTCTITNVDALNSMEPWGVSLEISTSDTHVRCTDQRSIHTGAGGITVSIAEPDPTKPPISNVSVRDCTFDGLGMQTGVAIKGRAVDVTIEGNDFWMMMPGVDIQATRGVVVRRNRFAGTNVSLPPAQISQIELLNSADSTIDQHSDDSAFNRSGGGPNVNLVGPETSGNSVVANEFLSSSGRHVGLSSGAHGNTVRGNWFFGCGRDGTLIHDTGAAAVNAVTSNELSGACVIMKSGSLVMSSNALHDSRLYLEGGLADLFDIRFFLNDVLGTARPVVFSQENVELSDTDPTSASFQMGNYWSHGCPRPFEPDVDVALAGLATAVLDSFAYAMPVAHLDPATAPVPPGFPVIDADGDDHLTPDSCALPNDDCDDGDGDIFPGHPEVCDGKDNDCNGLVDDGLDIDMDQDGHFAFGSCASPADDCDDTEPSCTTVCDDQDDDGVHACAGDCDDSDRNNAPNRQEVCDQQDNDCDGEIDEDFRRDLDRDGFIVGLGGCPVTDEDCDDLDATVFPGAPEICDGADNDCDLVVDEGCSCLLGETRECGTNEGACTAGEQDCIGGVFGPCTGALGPFAEVCDGLDNDCDGSVDEGCPCATGARMSCGTEEGECIAGVQNCVNGHWEACARNLGPRPEACDGMDNDCDGTTDEACPCILGQSRVCGSSIGICVRGLQHCLAVGWGPCVGAIGPLPEQCDAVLGLAGIPDPCVEGQTYALISAVMDPTTFEDPKEIVVAHELGHNLALRHGDGRNNNQDDQLDEPGEPNTDDPNLMNAVYRGSIEITSEQRAVIRPQALRHIPDRVVDPVPPPLVSMRTDPVGDVPGGHAFLDIDSVGLEVDLALPDTVLFQTVVGVFPDDIAGLRFTFGLDADGNPFTGGALATLGVPSTFAGAELVGRVDVAVTGGVATATPTAWYFGAEGFVTAPATAVQARAEPSTLEVLAREEMTRTTVAVGQAVSLRLPNELRGDLAAAARIEAVSELDGVPMDVATSALYFQPRTFALCRAMPAAAFAGDVVEIEALGFPHASAPVSVVLGGEVIATSELDDAGAARLEAFIPTTTPRGTALVRVQVPETGIAALCRLEVLDRPPLADAGGPYHTECAGAATPVTLDGSLSFDPEGDPLTFVWTGPFGSAEGEVVTVLLPTGEHAVTLTVIDAEGSSNTVTTTVGVWDTTAPAIEEVVLAPACLWPPSHRLVPYALGDNLQVTVSDQCDANPPVSVVAVQRSEPEDGRGDGSTGPDVVFGAEGLCLRAERAGPGSGREYTITIEAVDAMGNAAYATGRVLVPHDQVDARECPALPAAVLVNDGDPRCSF